MVELKIETRQQKLTRRSTNAWTKLVGVCMASETLAKIKAKQLRIKARKQRFGEQYLDFLQQGAPPETLQRCLTLARDDIACIETKIKSLQVRKEAIDASIKGKLLHKPDRWDSEKVRAKMMEQLMLTEPTDVCEVYFDEVDTDFVAYATPVHRKAW